METELKKWILGCNDLEPLKRMNHLIYEKIQILTQIKALEFEVGDKIKFFSKKKNRNMYGTITAIHKKNIKILTEFDGNWRTNAGLLEKV